MTLPNDTTGRLALPPLADLFAQYLRRQTSAHEAGFAASEAGPEVVPFEAVPAQPVDPRTAWTEALAALRFVQPPTETRSWSAPPDWADFVTIPEPVLALPLALGNFPQAVRNLNPLLTSPTLAALRPAPVAARSLPALAAWAAPALQHPRFPQVLSVLGVLRLAKHFEPAAELVRRQRDAVPAEWRAAWANEEAALAWHQGHPEEAAARWQSQEASAPVLFNRGMAALFADQPAEAHAWLTQAVNHLPEESSWHHLGRLYLALAEMRR